MFRLLLTLVSLVIFSCFAMAGSLAAEGPQMPAPAEDGPPQIDFLGRDGSPQEAPYFALEGAYPGMPSEQRRIALHNRGSAKVAYDISVAVSADEAGSRLADVLVVTVSDEITDRVVYRGPLSTLRFDGEGFLPAGGSAAYLVAIDWPDGGAADNAYQGVRLRFELRSTARNA